MSLFQLYKHSPTPQLVYPETLTVTRRRKQNGEYRSINLDTVVNAQHNPSELPKVSIVRLGSYR
ncbi:hypothetical protein [Leptothoe sp. PORK10 BA2]|uniref:hypothetical protein n=1 Tax=Leptothoe sp. PORK10 BA2 TaxID=3110254 RepID=UPI002B1F32B0|nr:hypothetical protein [Leptothoe sp. PORK10 BA2]MEA5464210.1 hypothetical protein [Leptothoe sp. PORK10 BA2]